ncbi:TrkH-domain-containing protein [Venturia nashicola]|uniref:Potassium transport protein n=1 Tax=Venturia nashicola TaxID=86259 RepID=A0A4Z1PKB8_9PEZI|nr:TrkH-domain-containing protein [Venturia nashicola]
MPRLPDLKGRLKPFNKAIRTIRRQLPDLNFITIHYLYFVLTSLLFAVVLWGSSTPSRSVRFIDCLFLAVSAMTEAGLNTVNLSTLNSFQQVLLFLLIIVGSAIFVSSFVVAVRKKAFDERFRSAIERENRLKNPSSWFSKRKSRGRSRDREEKTLTGSTSDGRKEEKGDAEEKPPVDLSHDQLATLPSVFKSSSSIAAKEGSESGSIAMGKLPTTTPTSRGESQDHITFHQDTRFRGSAQSPDPSFLHRAFSLSGVGAQPERRRRRTLSMQSSASRDGLRLPKSEQETSDAGSSMPHITRNSNFSDLTEADKLRLGGKEYKAVSFLAWVVPIYFILWQLLGALALGAYVSHYYPNRARENGLDPWWVGVFNAVSAFNNSGMSLLDANMTAFNKAIYMLLTMSLLILAGNTCYPIFLRLIVWTMYKLLPDNEKWSDSRDTLKFLLDHPRRCYTNLFPSEHTWWLALSVVVLNGIDCAAFVVLNIGNPEITRYSPGIEFVDGLFQATAVRSGGFYVVPIPTVRISLQVLYVTMMYISAFPVAITIRNSNVYEERSLGIYSDDVEYEELEAKGKTFMSWAKKRFGGARSNHKGVFVQQQLRAQLAHDIWLLVLAVFLIMIIEGSQFQSNPATFSVFNVIFEVVSGYGTVGISVGLPDQAYSFCGSWHTLSKLILCAVMLRGRHRGLPVAIDKAVLLPHDTLNDSELDDLDHRTEMSAQSKHAV